MIPPMRLTVSIINCRAVFSYAQKKLLPGRWEELFESWIKGSSVKIFGRICFAGLELFEFLENRVVGFL